MSRFAVVTISDSRYSKKSLAMLASVRNFNSDVDLYFIVTDSQPGFLPSEEVKYLTIEELVADSLDLIRLYSGRNSVEVATAIKPFSLIHLLNLGYESVVYLDPDILVVNSLHEIFEISSELGTLITPHRLTTNNLNYSISEDLKFLEFGVFNLGFIAVSQGSRPLLEWWGSRTLFSSTENRFEPVFTDQKWMDLSPIYFDLQILKEAGANVAYWNIDERVLKYSEDEGFTCNKGRLLFIHFSQSSDKEISKEVVGGKWSLLKHNPQAKQTLDALISLRVRWEALQQSSLGVDFQQRRKRFRKRKKRIFFTFSALKRGILLDWIRLMSLLRRRRF